MNEPPRLTSKYGEMRLASCAKAFASLFRLGPEAELIFSNSVRELVIAETKQVKKRPIKKTQRKAKH